MYNLTFYTAFGINNCSILQTESPSNDKFTLKLVEFERKLRKFCVNLRKLSSGGILRLCPESSGNPMVCPKRTNSHAGGNAGVGNRIDWEPRSGERNQRYSSGFSMVSTFRNWEVPREAFSASPATQAT